jgi:hypothetical protein
MALSALDQLRITKGEINPSAVSLDELVHQAAAIFAVDFQTNYNILATDEPALSYVNKLINAGQKVLKPSGNEIPNLSRVLIVILGTMSVTITQVQNATDVQWATFIQDNIQEALEILANVKQDEKIAYNAL